jgi:CDGSH-type Zn-finger protein
LKIVGFYSPCIIIFAPNKTTMASTKLTINNNGSVKIDGDFEIVDMQGNAYGLQGRTVVSICRCGLSANKPFCDGSHKGHFEHDAIAFDLPPKKV